MFRVLTMNPLLKTFLNLRILIACQSEFVYQIEGDVNLGNQNNEPLKKQQYFEQQDHTCRENTSYVWCIPSHYNVEEDPFRYTSLTNITLPWSYDFKFIIKEVSNVDDKSQSISVSMYFSVRWFEPRLMINPTAEDWTEPKLGPDDHVNVSPETIKYLWYPDLEIYGLEKFNLHKVLKEMSGVRIIKNRTIDYELRVVVTISCQMNFNNYPLDSQECPFQVGSYFGTVKTVTCTSYFEFDEERQRSLQYFTEIKSLSEKHRNVTLPSGDYAACGFTIFLTRMRMQNIIQVYLPTTMFVMVSWVSFLIKPEIIPGRMALLITLFLVLINIFNGVKADAPASKRLNAIDLYLVVCIFLVFAALAEYSIILYIQKKFKKLIVGRRKKNHDKDESYDTSSIEKQKRYIFEITQSSVTAMSTDSNKTPQRSPSHLHHVGSNDIELKDKISRDKTAEVEAHQRANQYFTEALCENVDMISLWVSPIIFIIFSIVYWSMYF